MTESPLKLPRNADELLRDFPLPEPDFEAQAKAIEARLSAPTTDAAEDWLKAPELEPEPGEPAAPSSVRSTAPKVSFTEMARRSVQKKDDSAEIARELLAASAQNRRPSAEMVERVRAAGRSATSTPLPATASPLPTGAAEEAGRPSGVVTRPTPASSAPAGTQRGVIIGVLGGVLALAAGVALLVRGEQSEPQASAPVAVAVAQTPADAAKVAAGRPVSEPVNQASSDGVVSPEALAASPQPRADAPAAIGKSATGAAAPAAVDAALKSAPSASGGSKPLAVVLEEDPAPPQADAPLAKAEAPAVEPQLKPAEGNAGSVPLNPSAGAISTALNGVRANAQACLAGQTEPVRAVVTFAADGHVLRVSADGPAGPCIQAALSKAHIAPFARDSFSAPTTIRPP